tara:strand:- start:160 stop:483 length:324 start_codon:yes stop_codon:yes gene_type:complete
MTAEQKLVLEVMKSSAVIIYHAKNNKILDDNLLIQKWVVADERGFVDGFQSNVILSIYDITREVNFWTQNTAEWCIDFLGLELITPLEFLNKLLDFIHKTQSKKSKN